MRLRIGILTISDRVSRGEMEDRASEAIEAALAGGDWDVTHRAVVADEADEITSVLTEWSDQAKLDVILTTGGTGLGPRDVTPEATMSVARRDVPGIAEALRAAGLQSTPHAMLSRAVSAVRGTTLIVNLPGSPNGAQQGIGVLAPILAHAVAILHGGRH